MTGEIELLKQRIERLEVKLATMQTEICPLCGSVTRRSPQFDESRFCQQEYGHCGEWILCPIDAGVKRGHWPGSFFKRTHIKKGKIEGFNPLFLPFRHFYFVAGKEVSEEEWHKLCEM
jgi:hypothetical protein